MDRMQAKQMVDKAEVSLKKQFKLIDDQCLMWTGAVLSAFREANVSLSNMSSSTGYGYEDTAKPKLCEVYKHIFGAEEALVCPQITCGTHALTLPLFGILRPGDTCLCITGRPYDTLDNIISGSDGEDIGSLKDFGINFEYIDMIGNKIDIAKVLKAIKSKSPKMVYIQRSRGYSDREALSVNYIGEVIKKVKAIDGTIIVMVDNCYCEFTEDKEPTMVGADIMAGSLMKNPGGGVAPTGGYVVGKKKLVDLAGGRLTSPGIGIEVGSYANAYYPFFEGIFLAPHVVAGALKGTLLLGKILEEQNIETTPRAGVIPHDIVRSIIFRDEKKQEAFCQLVQRLSPIDAQAVPIAWAMPGYKDKVISGGGTFVQGSTMELSCDGPVRDPYICYIQGGLTYEHVKLLTIEFLLDK